MYRRLPIQAPVGRKKVVVSFVKHFVAALLYQTYLLNISQVVVTTYSFYGMTFSATSCSYQLTFVTFLYS